MTRISFAYSLLRYRRSECGDQALSKHGTTLPNVGLLLAESSWLVPKLHRGLPLQCGHSLVFQKVALQQIFLKIPLSQLADVKDQPRKMPHANRTAWGNKSQRMACGS